MKFIEIILLASIFVLRGYGAEIELSLVSQGKVKVGDSFNAVARTKSSMTQSKFEEFLTKNENDFGPFYVAKLSFIKREDDWTVLGLGLVYREPVSEKLLSVIIGGERYKVHLTEPEVFDLTPLSPEPQFMVRVIENRKTAPFRYFLLLPLVFILAFFYYLYWKKQQPHRMAKKIRHEKLKFWKKTFSHATTREQFEKIYKDRKEWMEFLVTKKTAKGFLNDINKHQYKENWDDSIVVELKSKLAKVNLEDRSY